MRSAASRLMPNTSWYTRPINGALASKGTLASVLVTSPIATVPARNSSEMPASIAYLLEHRKQTVGDEPIDLGAHSDLLYVGTPTWDVGSRTIAGPPEVLAERINELGAMGVSHVQVRFRSRDLEEQVDQMAAFGAEVGPLLRR